VGSERPATEMKADPRLFFALAIVAIAVIPLSLWILVTPAPAVISACGPPPSPHEIVSVPPDQDTFIGSTGANNTRLSIWSNSSSTYDVFVLTQGQYSSFGANGTGPNGSVHFGPPSSYYWSSGEVTSTNHTLLLGLGVWYTLIFNPGSTEITVEFAAVSCNAP
jgi:hypothetical protein